VYEGEQEGAHVVAENLIKKAIKTLFPTYFPEIKKLEKQSAETPYDDIISWFFNADEDFELLDDFTEIQYKNELDKIKPLDDFLQKHQPNMIIEDRYFVKEFVLWALVEYKKLSKHRFAEGTQFKDPYGDFISGI
jgi:magnesium chelatase subunit I